LEDIAIYLRYIISILDKIFILIALETDFSPGSVFIRSLIAET
jgi:hypothetical protein